MLDFIPFLSKFYQDFIAILYDIPIINLTLKSMFKNKKIITFGLVVTMFAIFPQISHAETHVYSSDVRPDWTWDKEGSPYILEESIYIPREDSLYINEGVEVISTTTGDDPNTLNFDGDLTVVGTKENPVKFIDLYSLYLSNNTSHIKNAVFNKTGLTFLKATSTLDSVIITNAYSGISAKASHINITQSDLSNNTYAIVSDLNGRIFQSMKGGQVVPLDTGGIGNSIVGMADPIVDDTQNIIAINDSRIVDNGYFSIFNHTANTIDATDNWWGKKEGPNPIETYGAVDVSSWKEKDPNINEDICCSNILFIPGFEASRLYSNEPGLLGASTTRLWEPIVNNDVKKLYMDSKGKSLDPTVHTKDIISVALDTKGIYMRFIDSMNDLVKKGSINAWQPLAYDWRKAVTDIVTDDVVKSVSTLASTSLTGKITIIAHSNGGLVTKVLMKKLEALGKSNLVEKILFVAVPELGTPEALGAMLHGEDQGIAYGLILNESNARTFAQNLPGAYGLLPSRKFFEKNPLAVIRDFFASNSIITSFDAMRSFLLKNPFSQASTTDTNIPLILNSNLFSLGDKLHADIDSWKAASTTKVTSIFGWGKKTTEGIRYTPEPHCVKNHLKNCPLVSESVGTTSGDGTVLTQSNSGNSSSTLFFNLKKLHNETLANTSHANILNSIEMVSKVQDIVTNKKVPPGNSSNYESYFSEKEPVDNDNYITIDIYSPVDIDVYDKQGRHTGMIFDSELPQLNQYIPEEGIPGSGYESGSRNKSVMLPYGQEYKISLSGNDAGLFILKTTVNSPHGYDDVLASTTFSEMPVTSLTNIDLIIGTSTDSLASTTIMKIDIDGDGTTDIVSHPIEFLHSTTTDFIKDMPTYLEMMRKTIISLDLHKIAEKNWLDRIDKIEKLSQKKNPKKLEKLVTKLSNNRFKNKKVTDAQKMVILKVFGDLLTRLESGNY